MTVYTEMIRLGVQDDIAQEIADAVHRSRAIVTTDILDGRIARVDASVAHLDARLSQMETRLVRTIHTSMIAMTGIFAAFVAAMAWVIR